VKIKETTVTEQLNSTREHFRNNVIPKDALALMDSETESLIRANFTDKALKVGDAAPDFILPNQHGKPVRLNDLLDSGAVIVTFYRGGWCPYCNIALRGLQRYLAAFKTAGAKLVAISPQLPDQSLSTAEKNDLDFEVLSDVGNKVAARFGIVHDVSAELGALYESFGHGLQQVNGAEGSKSLPLPATFVVDKDRLIKLAFVDVDYTKRLDPEDALRALQS
jgi:peroxiredoxin